jgi:DNA-binding NarL/FixJ family response regulator
MFKKVIIAEDFDSINEGLKTVLTEENIPEFEVDRYCDDVFSKIKQSIEEECPYDLLITDLHFKEDYRTGKIKSGEELLICLNREDIKIKTLVFSQNDRIEAVRNLFKKRKIDGYVVKGRFDREEIKKALKAISEGDLYASKTIDQALTKKTAFEVTNYDITLLNLLGQGLNQKEISKYFTQKGVKPGSNSAIEKRIKQLKAYFKSRNAIQLIAKAKDLGLI